MEETRMERITRIGNPRRPQGDEGEEMLARMNESHYEVTGWALGFFEFREDDRILDVGCGGGMTLKRMSSLVPFGRLTGVDYSATSVKMSRQLNADDIQSRKLEVLEASVERLPFEDQTFDKIITVESFYFWPDPAENLKEVRRVLKKGGTFLLVADIYQKEGLKEQTIENIRKYDLFNPTLEEFQSLMEQAGFSDIVIHTKEGEDWVCAEGKNG